MDHKFTILPKPPKISFLFLSFFFLRFFIFFPASNIDNLFLPKIFKIFLKTFGKNSFSIFGELEKFLCETRFLDPPKLAKIEVFAPFFHSVKIFYLGQKYFSRPSRVKPLRPQVGFFMLFRMVQTVGALLPHPARNRNFAKVGVPKL